MFTKEGTIPGIQYPISPGHEVAGVIDKVRLGGIYPCLQVWRDPNLDVKGFSFLISVL